MLTRPLGTALYCINKEAEHSSIYHDGKPFCTLQICIQKKRFFKHCGADRKNSSWEWLQ